MLKNEPPTHSVRTLEDEPLSKIKTWAWSYRSHWAAMNDKSVLLPAPVGPNMRVWPTSPTLLAKRNAVLPRHLARKCGGPFRWLLPASPAQMADKGIKWARLRVCTTGLRT